MSTDLTCYGDDIKALADLVGDFELRSPMDVATWYRRDWQAIADVLGFAQQLTAMPTAVATTDRIAAMNTTGLAAFERALQSRRIAVSDEQARVQSAALRQLVAAAPRGELWRVSADPTALQSGACYPEGGRSLRAFYPDTAPGYFGEGWPGPPPRAESACGWTTPLVLHLGTFPWVYSSRLEAVGPGMRWAASTSNPALLGLQIAVSLLEPRTNLQQDARQIATIFHHFSTQTAPLMARVPLYQPGLAEIGRLYRRGGFLYVHQGSIHVAGLDGPRGHIAASAYNYIVRRFASFFAVRRATIRALPNLSPEVQQLAQNAADPCLRQQSQGVARAG